MKRLFLPKQSYCNYWTIGILFLGIFLRILYIYCDPILSRDSILFITAVDSGTLPSGITPSGWIALLQLGSIFGISTLNWGLGLSFFAGILLLFCIGEIGFYFFLSSRQAGNLCCFLAAVNPKLLVYSSQPQKESIFLLLLSVAMLCAIYAEKKKADATGRVVAITWICAGFFVVCATGIRHEGIEYILFLPLLLLFRENIKSQWKKILICTGMFFIGCFLGGLVVASLTDSINRLIMRLLC